jgi:hypothetical protein
MYFKFDMRVGFPVERFERYTKYLTDFCIRLNQNILREIADKQDGDAFSPEEYDCTGDYGEELGHGRARSEDYYYPSKTLGMNWRGIEGGRPNHRIELRNAPLLAQSLETGRTEFTKSDLRRT